tara:strand:+ start:395 stop:811 length:417 start_codon:yes stop_codon:yes gene_type:complete
MLEFSDKIKKMYNEFAHIDIQCAEMASVGAWWLYEAMYTQPIEIRTVYYANDPRTRAHTVCVVQDRRVFDFSANLYFPSLDFGFEECSPDQEREHLFKEIPLRSHRFARWYSYSINDIIDVKKTYLLDKEFFGRLKWV